MTAAGPPAGPPLGRSISAARVDPGPRGRSAIARPADALFALSPASRQSPRILRDSRRGGI